MHLKQAVLNNQFLKYFLMSLLVKKISIKVGTESKYGHAQYHGIVHRYQTHAV